MNRLALFFIQIMSGIVETQYLASPHRFAHDVFLTFSVEAQNLAPCRRNHHRRCCFIFFWTRKTRKNWAREALRTFFYFTRSARNFMERTNPRALLRCVTMLVSAKRCIEYTERIRDVGLDYVRRKILRLYWWGCLYVMVVWTLRARLEIIGYPFGVFNPSSSEQDLFNLLNSYLRRALCVQYFLSSVI